MSQSQSQMSSTCPPDGYGILIDGIGELLEQSRRQAVRKVNSLLTSTYWAFGRRIVEFEQGGADRSEYGERLLERLSSDLTARYGRGFSRTNLAQMRAFYQAWEIVQTSSAESSAQTPRELPDDGMQERTLPTVSAELAARFASRHMTHLPDEETLRREILLTQQAVRARLQEDGHDG